MWFAVKETKLAYWEENESIDSTLLNLKGSNNKGQNLILMIE